MEKVNMKKIFVFSLFVLVVSITANLTITPEYYGEQFATSFGHDWKTYFYPALQAFLSGQSPYSVDGFYNFPWLIILLLPLAFLSPHAGACFMLALNIGLFIHTMTTLRIRAWLIPFVLAFSGMAMMFFSGNIDGLVAYGFVAPFGGMFLLVLKPQLSIGYIVWLFFTKWKKDSATQLHVTFWPVSVTIFLSVALYGMEMFTGSQAVSKEWNASMFPYGIPMGLAILILAFKHNDKGFAIASSIFFAPYYFQGSEWVVILGLLSSETVRNLYKRVYRK